MHLLQILWEFFHFACVCYNIIPFVQAESIQSIDIIEGNMYCILLAQWMVFTLTEIKFVVTVHYSFIFSVCSSAYFFPVTY